MPDEEIKAEAPPLSEDDLALKFTERHKNDLRYTAEVGKWHRLSRTNEGGAVWLPENKMTAFSDVRKLVRDEAGENGTPGRLNKLCSAATISAVEKLAKSDQRTAMTAEEWDSRPMILNTPSGIIDLENGKRLPGDPNAFCTKITAVGPSTARPELWLQCMNTWTRGDEALQNYLQSVVGYCLSGSIREQQFMFLYGSGRNGKGVFLNTVSGIMSTYARVCPADVFTASKFGESHTTGLAGLMGCRLAVATETESNSRWAESRLKLATGETENGKISARFMRRDYFDYTPQFKLLISGNHKPHLTSVDEAIRRRLRLIPFEVTIPESECDKKLPAKLKLEWPAILGWFIQGCANWQRDGLKAPACVQEKTDEYMAEQDTMGLWIDECCVSGPNCRAKTEALYASWKHWCEASEQFVTSQKFFSGALKERPAIKPDHTEHGNFIRGIGLKSENGYAI